LAFTATARATRHRVGAFEPITANIDFTDHRPPDPRSVEVLHPAQGLV
jgi:hypothetical protein